MNIRPDITPSPVRPRETGDAGSHDVTHLVALDPRLRGDERSVVPGDERSALHSAERSVVVP